MADTNNSQSQTNEPSNEGSKTFTEKEFQSEVDKRVSQALKTQEEKFSQRLAESEKLARMNEQEKLSYELEKRESLLAERERAITLAENKNEALKILTQKGIDSSLVELVMADTAEEMNSKIKALEEAFNNSVKAEVEKRISGKSPKSSKSEGITKEDFSKMTLKQQQELANANPELYKSLISK